MVSPASGLVSWPSPLPAQLPVPLAHAYLRPHTLVSGPHLGAFGKCRALSTPQAGGVERAGTGYLVMSVCVHMNAGTVRLHELP